MSVKTTQKSFKALSTEVYIFISSNQQDVTDDLNLVVALINDFEKKFSRFIPNNELDVLNNSVDLTVTDELLDILTTAKNYYKKTNKLFDPTIYNALISEGYILSKDNNYYDPNSTLCKNLDKRSNFDLVKFIPNNRILKPRELKIDLGGIGKGYLVDKIVEILKSKYPDFCISLGGDLYVQGKDINQGYDYWAIEVSNPFEQGKTELELPTLLLSNHAVATSGVNKRNWLKNGITKNHIIDPRTNRSINTDLISATVIGTDTIFCDITAKVLMILGMPEGVKYCNINSISAVLISKSREIYITESATKYVWKP